MLDFNNTFCQDRFEFGPVYLYLLSLVKSAFHALLNVIEGNIDYEKYYKTNIFFWKLVQYFIDFSIISKTEIPLKNENSSTFPKKDSVFNQKSIRALSVETQVYNLLDNLIMDMFLNML